MTTTLSSGGAYVVLVQGITASEEAGVTWSHGSGVGRGSGGSTRVVIPSLTSGVAQLLLEGVRKDSGDTACSSQGT
jgi:uncharacterized protein (DUF2345 family)